MGRLDVVAPSAGDRVILLVTLFAFHLTALLRSAKIYRTLRRRRAENVFVCRPRTWHVCYWLLAYLPVGFVLLVSYGRLWTLLDIGATSSVHWALSILVGLLAGVAFQTVTYFFRRRNDPVGIPKSHEVYVLRCHLARGHAARMLLNFNTALFGPAFEELVYRGFFVYFLGETVGSTALGVLAGLLLCIWMHLHIGPRKLLSIVFFFAATTTLLYSPFGWLSGVSFHVACNAMYVTQLHSMANRYLRVLSEKRLLRTERRSRSVAGAAALVLDTCSGTGRA